jgi:hypothetical protein
MGAAGSIANGDAVSVVAGLPAQPWDGDIADIDLDGGTDIGEALADGDEILVRNVSGTPANRVSAMSRVRTYVQLTDVAGASNGDNTAAVNTRITTDISGYSANRTTTLPATFAVGDLVEVYVSVGDDTYAQLIAPAAGDTIDGGTAGAEWSRLFITGEKVRFRGVTANSAWTVDYDGRRPCHARLALTTVCDGETAWTAGYPTDLGGAWTISDAVGNFADASVGTVTSRRAGIYLASAFANTKDALATDRTISCTLSNMGSSPYYRNSSATSFDYNGVSMSLSRRLGAGVAIRFYYTTSGGGIGLDTSTTFTITELLS